jgi:hypothetical protein
MNQLKNISEGGSAPESRLNDAREVLEMVRGLVRSDEPRAKNRSRLKGLVDGNPPYNAAELKRTGQSFRTNCNFGDAMAYLGTSLSAFYDVFAEVPNYATVKCTHGTPAKAEEYSRILTEEFDSLQKKDGDFDYMMQLSQHEMVLYGVGPMLFEDAIDWRCKPVRAMDLLVPDETRSNVGDFSCAVVRNTYQVHELYRFIKNPEAAKMAGWSVEAARKAIIKAAPTNRGRKGNSWEYHQQQIRNNDLSYSSKSDVVQVAHVFYKEFPTDDNPSGAISHCIVDERGDGKDGFMFRRVARYENWNQCLHVMFYDKGDGQFHSCKGLGVKMYNTLELKNRLRNSLVDAAMFRSTVMMKPKSPNAMNRMNVVQMGPVSIIPPDFDVQQVSNAGGALDAPMAVDRELDIGLQGNLSQYRQRMDKAGNPRTATEIEAITMQQSVLGKTQLNRYYQQLDSLFAERYRRATNGSITKDSPGGELALEFQQRCKERGVPADAMSKALASATRVAGRGSPQERRLVMNSLMGMIQMLPEGGREQVIRDSIASMAGWESLERYYPVAGTDIGMQQQLQNAAQENVLFKHGVPTPVADTDNHAVHAQTHIQAATEAIQALQGGDVEPPEVLLYINAIAAHTGEHLAAMQGDASRADMVNALGEHLQQIIKIADGVSKELAKRRAEQEAMQAEEGAAQQQMQVMSDGLDPKDRVAQMRADREEARRDAKVKNDMERKTMKTQQDLALKDAKTAQKLRNQ